MNVETLYKKELRAMKVLRIIEQKMTEAEARLDELNAQWDRADAEFRKAAAEKQSKNILASKLRIRKMIEQSRTIVNNRLQLLLMQWTKLSDKEHVLFLKQFAETNALIAKGSVKLPNVNLNNNLIENFYNKPQALPNNASTNTAPLVNASKNKRGTFCNAMGRCFEGLTARLTRNNKKTQGGKRSHTRRRK